MKTLAYWVTIYLFIFFPLTGQLLAEPKKPESDMGITTAVVRENIDTIKKKPNIDESLKIRILNAYYATEDNLDELLLLNQQTQKLESQLKSLPVEIKQLEQRIGAAEKGIQFNKTENLSVFTDEQLESRLVEEKSNLNELDFSIQRLETQIAEQFKRPEGIRVQKADAKNTLATTQQEQNALLNRTLNKLELSALNSQFESRSRKLNTLLAKLDLENIVYPLTERALKLKLQWLNLQRQQLSVLIKKIDNYLIEKRQQEINKAQEELLQTQKEAAGKHVLIQEATNENIHYSQILQETNRKLEKYLDKNYKTEVQYKQLEADFKSAEKKIELAGLSPALGNLLREQRLKLPLLKAYQPTFDKIQEEVALASLELFKLNEVKKSLASIDQAVSSRISRSVVEITDESEKTNVRNDLRILLTDQKDLVSKLGLIYPEYTRTLADVDFSMHQLVALGEQYRHYLDQRLLWVPSAPVIDQNYAFEIFDAVVWFIQVYHWQKTATDLKQSVQSYPIMTLLGLVIFLISVIYKRNIKRNLQALLKRSAKPYADKSSFTFYGLGYAFLLRLPLPLFVAWLGGILHMNGQAAVFSHSVAQGLLAASLPLLLIQFFYQIFKPMGVVQSLFYWQQHSVQLLYSQLKWLRFVVIPAVFIITMFADDTYYKYSYSIGRLALIIAMLALSYMYHRLAHPVTGLAKDLYLESPKSWSSRLRYVWYGLVVLIPLVIVGFAIAGYYQSALELKDKLVVLIRLVFFTTLLHEVVMRGMFLANRQLALQNARQKRKLLDQSADKDKVAEDSIHIEEEPLLDIPKINEQSKAILRAVIIAILVIGSWITLKDVLPAFSIFNNIVLWQHMAMIKGEEILQPITLVDGGVCLVYLLLMIIFVKNFPGLTDLLLAGRYNMSAGSRYALIQLTRYAVISLTFITIASKLGGSWSQVQWLVAAVSVGLGFGLQEIFANMVSGIILLFERPIRVGDTVTVGGITGKVCRIQMRATTLVDWDQKELIVPNKTFITSDLINWTLSDTVTRIVIPVGISYEDDEDLAQQLLMKVVEEAPLVLKEPAPSIYFLGLGDSSLNFEVRIYVRELTDRLPVTDDLLRRIRRAFKQNNIEIPFPQRDLHIRSAVKPI